jgi:hypothetical protein
MVDDWRAIVEFLNAPAAKAVYLVTFALMMVLTAVYAISAWRDRNNQVETHNDHLTKFRELRERGVLREFEYRTIKTALAEKIHAELNRDGENS